MKIVRLDRRYKAYKQGFRIALKFPRYSGDGGRYDRGCERILGSQYQSSPTGEPPVWKDFFGTQTSIIDTFEPGQSFNHLGDYPGRSYYIAFRDAKYLTWIQLSMTEVDSK